MTSNAISSFRTYGGAPFFVFCDHASNAVPDDLHDLGLPSDILATHIAWDIGAANLAAAIAERLGGALFRCAFSRLVLDANRPADSADLIPAASDQIPIPGNRDLTERDRQARVERFHTPYHAAFSAALSEICEGGRAPFVISVHSFTNRLRGAVEDRPWPIGVLWREDRLSAQMMIDYLAARTGWPIGDNEPYDARAFNYSVDRHVDPRGLRHLTLEARQDMIADPQGVAEFADILTEGVLRVAAAPSAA